MDVSIERKSIDDAIEGDTVPSSFLRAVSTHPDIEALRWRGADHNWHSITYEEFSVRVACLVTALKRLGVKKGDRVALLMANRYEFHIADVAVQFCGATPFSLYNSASTEQLRFVVSHSEVKLAIIERSVLPAFRIVKSQSPILQQLVVLDADEKALSSNEQSWESIQNAEPANLSDLAPDVSPTDIATIIYTSGTTGPPKGVMISQANVCWTVESYRRRFGIDRPGMKLISYLPMAHVAERIATFYTPLVLAYTIAPCPDMNIIREYLTAFRPNAIFGVPRVWEKFYANAIGAFNERKTQKAIFQCLSALYNSHIPGLKQIGSMGLSRIGARILDVLGLDEVVFAVSGGAPIESEILNWFRSIGFPLSEVYGMSENTGPMTWDPFEVKVGTVGRPLPGVELRIAEDGEVLCRGGNVFVGYLKDQEKTDEAMKDGWLFTGDIGTIDEQGYLCIVDRKKELIITAGGKNISPGNLEAAIKSHPLIGHACAIGDKRPFMSALIVLDSETAEKWSRTHGMEWSGLAEFSRNKKIIEEIDQHMRTVNSNFSQVEQIKKFQILDHEWIPDSTELTPTMKLKRRNILSRYELEIEAIYQG